jgi:hypothetical protein
MLLCPAVVYVRHHLLFLCGACFDQVRIGMMLHFLGGMLAGSGHDDII